MVLKPEALLKALSRPEGSIKALLRLYQGSNYKEISGSVLKPEIVNGAYSEASQRVLSFLSAYLLY